jgi:hypothetical protein
MNFFVDLVDEFQFFLDGCGASEGPVKSATDDQPLADQFDGGLEDALQETRVKRCRLAGILLKQGNENTEPRVCVTVNRQHECGSTR